MSPTLAIGIGNPDRGDDAAGVMVVRRLTSTNAIEARDCSQLLEMWAGQDDVVVIDAMRSGQAPGTVVRIDTARRRLPAKNFPSSHSLGLSETVELARALGRLPQRLTIYGIEGANFELGAAVSTEVEDATRKVAGELEPHWSVL